MPKKKEVLYVAVVCKTGGPWVSNRAAGDWASFISLNKDAAIKRALKANKDWGEKYNVLVGELSQQATQPIEFKLVKI